MKRKLSVPTNRIKSPIAKFAFAFINLLSKSKSGQTFLTLTTLFTVNQSRSIKMRAEEIDFAFVSDTWLTKRFTDVEELEPDTLSWIDSFEEKSVLWDIGANIGGYSIYAAKAKNSQVIAFEPSPFNLEFLARNIWLNGLERNITVIPIALSEFTASAPLRTFRTEWASSRSNFGDGDMHVTDYFTYPTVGIPIDLVSSIFNLSPPGYINLDVDGIEGLILAGGKNVLSQVKQVLVELPEGSSGQDLVITCLSQAGLRKQRVARHNEIWVRD
jgi:FkbM family methyltransferase